MLSEENNLMRAGAGAATARGQAGGAWARAPGPGPPRPARSTRAHSSSCFIRCERRVTAGFRELVFASEASVKNLKIDGKLFQEVSS